MEERCFSYFRHMCVRGWIGGVEMKIKYAAYSRHAKPWVRRWMLWGLGVLFLFLPNFFKELMRAPFQIARQEWEELRDEVMSYKISEKGDK